MSIMEYNGGAVIAMVGKDCVGIACDRRFGIQQLTHSNDFDKVFPVSDKLYVGLPGLATDMQTVYEKLLFRVNMFRLQEEREISPAAFTKMVSAYLYEHRFGPFFVEPIIAGLEGADNKPFIASMDLIGCPMYTSDFVVGGTLSEALYGTCEAMFRPNMEADDLFETLAQCLLNSVDRDCLSGWGAVVHIISKDKVVSRTLKARSD